MKKIPLTVICFDSRLKKFNSATSTTKITRKKIRFLDNFGLFL